MSLRILSAGLLSTLQDSGRWGYQKEGVLVSGAMDLQALCIANLLVGNPDTTAGLEISLIGPRICFEEDQLIALSGADLSPTIDGVPVRMWRLIWVKKGAVLAFGTPLSGRFGYLAVAGGFGIAPVMGSVSTYIRAGIGGFYGRALQKGDLLPCASSPERIRCFLHQQGNNSQESGFVEASWAPTPELLPLYQESPVIRAMKGPEWALFTQKSRKALWEDPFTISEQADRMGYRLQGPLLTLISSMELLSSAVAFGTVQIPANGQPIVLLADHQTTGGYPRIAQVATADFSTLVQLPPGKSFHFAQITVQQAQQLYLAQEQRLKQLKTAIALKVNSPL